MERSWETGPSSSCIKRVVESSSFLRRNSARWSIALSGPNAVVSVRFVEHHIASEDEKLCSGLAFFG